MWLNKNLANRAVYFFLIVIIACSNNIAEKEKYAYAALNMGDYDTAIRVLNEIKEKSHNAQLILGNMYLNGYGIDKNVGKAKLWFEKASNSGNVEASFKLATLLLKERGQEKEGIKFLIKGALENHVKSQIMLAIINLKKENIEEYRYWIEMAIKSGSSYANYFDEAIKKDLDGTQLRSHQALLIYKSLNNDVDSQYELGKAFLEGQLINKDYGYARYWFKISGNAGNVDALFKLGLMNELAMGGPKDCARAYELYHKSAQEGSKEANERLSANVKTYPCSFSR